MTWKLTFFTWITKIRTNLILKPKFWLQNQNFDLKFEHFNPKTEMLTSKLTFLTCKSQTWANFNLKNWNYRQLFTLKPKYQEKIRLCGTDKRSRRFAVAAAARCGGRSGLEITSSSSSSSSRRRDLCVQLPGTVAALALVAPAILGRRRSTAGETGETFQNAPLFVLSFRVVDVDVVLLDHHRHCS